MNIAEKMEKKTAVFPKQRLDLYDAVRYIHTPSGDVHACWVLDQGKVLSLTSSEKFGVSTELFDSFGEYEVWADEIPWIRGGRYAIKWKG